MENPALPVPDESPIRCAYSGVMRPKRDMVRIGEHWIALEQKDAYVQFIQQGGAINETTQPVETPANVSLVALLSTAWKLYKGNFWLITALHISVWAPCNLLSGYIESHHLIKDTLTASYRLGQWMDMLFGVVAVAAVIHVVRTAWAGQRSTYSGALRFGLSRWFVMFRAHFLVMLATFMGFVLLIVPGFLMMMRSVFVPSFILDQDESATDSINSSWHLAKGYFWRIFGFSILVEVVTVLPGMILMFAASLAEGLLEEFVESPLVVEQFWLLDWVAESLGGVTMAFTTVFFFVFYKALCSQSETPGDGVSNNAPRLFTRLPVKSPFPPVPNSGNLPP